MNGNREVFLVDGSQSSAALSGSSAFVLALGLAIAYDGEVSSFTGLMDRAAVYPVALDGPQLLGLFSTGDTRYSIRTTGGTRQAFIPGLREGIEYQFRISAFNEVGEGVPADAGPPRVYVAAECGSGRRVGDEECDDGNLQSSDGCSRSCVIEPGFRCSGDFGVL